MSNEKVILLDHVMNRHLPQTHNPNHRKNGGSHRLNGKRFRQTFDSLPSSELHWQLMVMAHSAMFLCVQLYNIHGARISEANFVAICAIMVALLRDILNLRTSESSSKVSLVNSDLPKTQSHAKRHKLKPVQNRQPQAPWIVQAVFLLIIVASLSAAAWSLPFRLRCSVLGVILTYAWLSKSFKDSIDHRLSTFLSALEENRRITSAPHHKSAFSTPLAHKVHVGYFLRYFRASAASAGQTLSKSSQTEVLKKAAESVWSVVSTKILLITVEAAFSSFLVGNMVIWTMKNARFSRDLAACTAVHLFCFLDTAVLLWLQEITTEAELLGHLAGVVGCWQLIGSQQQEDIPKDTPPWDPQRSPYSESQIVKHSCQLYISVGWLNVDSPLRPTGAALMVFEKDPLVAYNWTVAAQFLVALLSLVLVALFRSWKALSIISGLSFHVLYLCLEARKHCRRRIMESGSSVGGFSVNGNH